MNSERKERREVQLAKKAETIEAAASEVLVINETRIKIDGRPYDLVENYHEGFNAERLGERFSQILTKYDYIVGDWGYDQLRLRGFYEIGSKKGSPYQSIERLDDYLYEYCNFGCAYFILKNCEVHDSFPAPAAHKKRRRKNSRSRANTNHKRSDKKSNYNNRKPKIQTVKSKNRRQGSRHFVIRKKKNNTNNKRRDQNAK